MGIAPNPESKLLKVGHSKKSQSFLFTEGGTEPIEIDGGKQSLFKNGKLEIDFTKDDVYIPIMFVKGKYPGTYADHYSFIFDYYSNHTHKILKNKSFTYDISFINDEDNSVRTIGNSNVINGEFTTKDETKNNDMSIVAEIDRNYHEKTRNLPLDVMVFDNNIKILASIASLFEDDIPKNLISADKNKISITTEDLEESLNNYTDYKLFNIFGLKNPYNESYRNLLLDTNLDNSKLNGVLVLPGNKVKLNGGYSSNIHRKPNFSSYINKFYNLEINSYLGDSARYPFTHIIDPGYDISNKFDLIEFASIRDDVIIELGVFQSPEFSNFHYSSMMQYEDYSMANVLNNYAQNMKESVIKGTGACRINIYCSTGLLKSTSRYFGLQYEICEKLSKIDNGQIIKSNIGGLPSARITKLEDFLWLPYNGIMKELLWENGFNYAQPNEINSLHIPSWRTIYKKEASVLTDANFSRTIVYIKHLVRSVWANFAGVKNKRHILQSDIKRELDWHLTILLNGFYRFNVEVYQTNEDELLGFVQRVRIDLFDMTGFRIGCFDINCNKE